MVIDAFRIHFIAMVEDIHADSSMHSMIIALSATWARTCAPGPCAAATIASVSSLDPCCAP